MPEHDLTLHLIWGRHSSEEAVQFVRHLDETCATRWLCYYHASADMAGMDVAGIPTVKRAVDEKRNELFGDKPKAVAYVSKGSEQYFNFWRRYDSTAGRAFDSLDEAYDWLGLSEPARTSASAIIQNLETEVASAT